MRVCLFPWCFSCCESPWSFWVFSVYFPGFLQDLHVRKILGVFEVFLGIFERPKKRRTGQGTKIQPEAFLNEVFGNPLGSWTSRLRVMDVRTKMLVFLQDLEVPDRSFEPGHACERPPYAYKTPHLKWSRKLSSQSVLGEFKESPGRFKGI